jgi:hypothetical protein
MAENSTPEEHPVRQAPPQAFWATARDWWAGATTDSGSVKRNLAMLAGVTAAVLLCIWSVGGVLAIIVGSVHVWSLAGAGAGVSVASATATVWNRKRRRRRLPKS